MKGNVLSHSTLNHTYKMKEIKYKIYSEVPELICGSSTVECGNVDERFGDAGEAVKSKLKFLKSLGIEDKNLIKATLPHEDGICNVIDNKNKKYAVDALITDRPGIFLSFNTADCLPIFYFDQIKKVAGIAHCGWKSTTLNLSAKVVFEFINKYGSKPKDVLVALGPAIRKESYIHKDPMQKNMPEWKNFLEDLPNGETAIDLVGYNVMQLIGAGIHENNIEICPINTVTSKDFFSHYRSQKNGETEGRFCNVIGLK